jgi:hypothetical protein
MGEFASLDTAMRLLLLISLTNYLRQALLMKSEVALFRTIDRIFRS